MTKFLFDFSHEVWFSTYKNNLTTSILNRPDENVDDTLLRIATDLASAETDPIKWTKLFHEALSDFKMVVGGRISSNAGTGLKGTTYINCFVSGATGYDQDSVEGIFDALTRAAKTLKSEGGYGFCANFIRPRGAFIYGVGVETPGAVEMLNLWDTMSSVITKGSGAEKKAKEGKNKIRKGAMMVTLSASHPDIIEFITAKQTPGVLSKFNMSVLIPDKLMEAIKTNTSWDLWFPDTTFEKYRSDWDGDFEAWDAKGYPKVIYRTFENANEIWDIIMQSTYNRNEPGVLFVDRMNQLNNLHLTERIHSTNPCLTGDTLVATDRGLVRFDNLTLAMNCLTNDATTGKSWNVYPAPIAKLYNSGVKEVIKLHLSNGMEIECTPDHKIWTEQGYIPASETLNKEVRLNIDYCFNESWKFEFTPTNEFIGANKREYKINLPKEWNEDVGFILGWATGDGWRTGDNSFGLIFGKDDAELISKARSIYDSWMVNYTEVVDKNGSTTLYTNSSLMGRFLDQLGFEKCKAKNKQVPESIFTAPRPVVAAFLRALFSSDGSVLEMANSNYWVSLCSSSKKLINEVQQLLLMFGISHHTAYFINKSSSFDYTTTEGEDKQYIGHPYYDLRVFGKGIVSFFNEIGFDLEYKKLKLAKLQTKRFKNKTSIVSIESIESTGQKEVFDLTENINHSFEAAGITVKNCGEQILPIGGVCLLGSLNLTQFINTNLTDWDYEKLAKLLPIFVRLLDNVNDKTLVPLEEQKWNLENKRRIGIGYLGYGSALYLMRLRYGSKEALKMTEKLCSFVTNKIYQASSALATEKGSYPLFNLEEFLSSKFVKQALSDETIEMIKKNGLRNSHLTSIQPTGNTSILANNVSGGLEPIFMPEYIRTSIVAVPPQGLVIPTIDWANQSFSKGDWRWIKEGDESLLTTTFEDIVFKIDRNRGLCKETLVEDYAVHTLKKLGQWNSQASWAVDTVSLSVDEHVETMKVFARYIDSAMSKTVNLPNNYPYEDFKKLYMNMYDSGYIKGGTTYRAGTMTTVLSAKDEKKESTNDSRHARKRPKELDCDVHHLTVNGEKWVVFVGLLDQQPYELFAGLVDAVDLSKKIKTGKIIKVATGKYSFQHEDIIEIKDITKAFNNPTQGAITRLLSTSLRHGVEAKFLVTQLLKTGEGLNTFAKSLARTLKKYVKEGEALTDSTCPECNSKNLIMSEGCNKCLSCGYSGCS